MKAGIKGGNCLSAGSRAASASITAKAGYFGAKGKAAQVVVIGAKVSGLIIIGCW
ncbi:MAG: hypothetical protein IPG70_16500 [Moraxellaceae bacterium]|nr:hypothetical protein [Moraxellaceae bacterium]